MADTPHTGLRSLRTWLGPAGIAVTALVAATGGDPVRALARYERSAIAGGELWRLLTGHLVHLGWSHTFVNLAGLAVMAILFADRFRTLDWLLVTLFAVAAVDLGLYLAEPGLAWYVGLSGVLHGIWSGGALVGLARGRPGARWLLGLLLAKLVWEAAAGPLAFSVQTTGGAVVVEAHLYGALGGLAWAASRWIVQSMRGCPI